MFYRWHFCQEHVHHFTHFRFFYGSSINECRFLIKFTFIADQIHDIFINVTGNQYKSILLSVVESLNLWKGHETTNYIYM